MDKKQKKEIINPINDDDKYFQYTVKFALNHKEIGKNDKECQKLSLL